MADARFDAPLARVREAEDRKEAIASLTYEEVILALGAASRERDPYLANVLASELLNRSRRGSAALFSAGLGVASAVVLLVLALAFLGNHPHNFNDHLFLIVAFVVIAVGALAAWLAHPAILTRILDRRV